MNECVLLVVGECLGKEGHHSHHNTPLVVVVGGVVGVVGIVVVDGDDRIHGGL